MTPQQQASVRLSSLAASVGLIGLIFLGLYWEMAGAPIHPGGSWMVLKITPLLFAVFGILRGTRYTYQWSSLLALLYLMEGLVRATSDQSPTSRAFAWCEVALACLYFGGAVAYARLTRPAKAPGTAQGK